MKCLLAVAVTALAGCPAAQVTPPAAAPAPPIVHPTPPASQGPSEPTLRLPRTFLPARYDARLDVDPAGTGFIGEIAITGTLEEATRSIWLHGRKLTVTKARARRNDPDFAIEVRVDVTPRGEDLLLVQATTPLAAGRWTLILEYTGDFELVSTAGAFKQTVQDASYVFTQLEAVYARRVFPCFDEPDNKVPWKLTLDVPAKLVAVANTPVARETVLSPAKKRVEFAVTKPLPTYLVAFGVGPFDIVDAGATKRGTPVRIVTLAKRAQDAAYAVKTAARIVDVAEEWFGTPYPYEKLDLLTIPLTVGFGAMENAGLITFRESLILLDPKASVSRQRAWITVASHEVAHQWFGNLVTMQFWDDIWLNEGFATWITLKLADTLEPSWREPLSELEGRNYALEHDSLVSARKIRQPIETPDDILNAFDGITYSKGASVLNMFEAYVGPDKFRQGVREYLAARAWGNATSTDFAAAISKVAGQDLTGAFASFLDHAGAPEVTATLACNGGKAMLALAQQRYSAPGSPPATGGPWSIPMCVAYDRDGKRAETCTLLERATDTLALDAKRCPRWVMPNARGRGYYRTAYTATQLSALRDEAWAQLDSREHRALFFDVSSGLASGRVSLAQVLSFVPRLLGGTDRHSLAAALAVPISLDAWVPDAQRGKYEHWMRATFGRAALEAGIASKPTDTLDTELARKGFIHAVGWLAREPALIAEAVRLAAAWRDLPQGMRGLVLQLAIDADAAQFDRTAREVVTEPDRTRRLEMIDALAAVRDPGRHARALALVLEPTLDIRESINLLYGNATEAGLARAQAFFLANKAAILARIPKDATANGAGRVAYLFTRTCRAEKRDEIAMFVTTELSHFPGAKRIVKQALEGMDQCIAKRARLEPELAAWLGGIKMPTSRASVSPP